MRFENVIKLVAIFSAGFIAGVHYANKKLEAKHQARADEQIQDMKDAYKEKEKRLVDSFEERSKEKGIQYAMEHLDLQRENGSSIYETQTPIHELLKPEEFGELDDYETSFLTLYKDGTLAFDSDGSKVEDIERIVGPKTLSNIGKYASSMIHVRNYIYKKDYVIVKYRDESFKFNEALYDKQKHTFTVYDNGKYVKTVALKQ